MKRENNVIGKWIWRSISEELKKEFIERIDYALFDRIRETEEKLSKYETVFQKTVKYFKAFQGPVQYVGFFMLWRSDIMESLETEKMKMEKESGLSMKIINATIKAEDKEYFKVPENEAFLPCAIGFDEPIKGEIALYAGTEKLYFDRLLNESWVPLSIIYHRYGQLQVLFREDYILRIEAPKNPVVYGLKIEPIWKPF